MPLALRHAWTLRGPVLAHLPTRARAAAHPTQTHPPCLSPASLSPPHAGPPCPQLLKKVPTAHPRGLALQQSAAAVLLERLLPAAKLGGKSAARRRGGAAPDPAAVIAAQPWCACAAGVVGWGVGRGATRGMAGRPGWPHAGQQAALPASEPQAGRRTLGALSYERAACLPTRLAPDP